MTETIKAYAQSKPAARMDFKEEWQWYRALIDNKTFMSQGSLDGRDFISVKLAPEHGEFLRQQHLGVIIPGYYLNKVHWNTCFLDQGLDQPFLESLVDESYDIVFKSLSKKRQKELINE